MDEFQKNISSLTRIKYGAFQFMDHFIGRKNSFALTRPLRKKLYKSLEKKMQQGEKGKVFQIERRTNLSKEEFQSEYLLKNRPVIFDGKASNWDCVKNWSLDYLKKKHGEDQIVVVDQQDEESPFEELTLAKLIDGINDGLSRYYRFYPLIQKHPERLLDFDYKWLQEQRHKKVKFDTFQVFIGPDGSYTPLHNAGGGNLFTQVYGEKEWILYPNYYTAIMDPNPVRSNYRGAPMRKEYGPFNPFNPEYTPPYQLFKYIDSYRGTLKPGDVLFNPPYWWHAVKNHGATIGVGYRWLPLGFNFKHSPLYTFLDLCTIRPPVWKTWKLSQTDPNLIFMAESGRLKEYLTNKNS